MMESLSGGGAGILIKYLREEFQRSFMDELVPGILHNFANPLNGIMGRSRLLQRRLDDSFEKTIPPTGRLIDDFSKIRSDVELIVRGGDQLFDQFTIVAEKFQRLNDYREKGINLSEFLEREIAFFQFYLDFKHKVCKQINLDHDIPEIIGVPAVYSLGLSAVIRHAILSMADSEIKQLDVATSLEGDSVSVVVGNTGCIRTDERMTALRRAVGVAAYGVSERQDADILAWAFALLKESNVHIEVEDSGGVNKIALKIPCRRDQ
ncbi:MAG: HAMP domain-containing histidine kinase [Deltaproteobacteria bacterium]|nr:HAMP domain-containing histidine kinase [Deltaproteobacteria bacterium]